MKSFTIFLAGAALIQLHGLVRVHKRSSKPSLGALDAVCSHNAMPVSGLLSGGFVDEALCNETHSSRHAA